METGQEMKLHTADEIAAEQGVTRETVLRWIRKGDLQAEKVGGKYQVSEEAYEDWALLFIGLPLGATDEQKARRRELLRERGWDKITTKSPVGQPLTSVVNRDMKITSAYAVRKDANGER